MQHLSHPGRTNEIPMSNMFNTMRTLRSPLCYRPTHRYRARATLDRSHANHRDTRCQMYEIM